MKKFEDAVHVYVPAIVNVYYQLSSIAKPVSTLIAIQINILKESKNILFIRLKFFLYGGPAH
jgi:hypothetical protein